MVCKGNDLAIFYQVLWQTGYISVHKLPPADLADPSSRPTSFYYAVRRRQGLFKVLEPRCGKSAVKVQP